MNYISTAHARVYFQQKLAKQTAKLAESNAAYEAARERYHGGLWFKIFGTPFEETSDGNKGWLGHNNWQIYQYERWIRETEAAIATCKYHQKMEHPEIVWAFPDHNISGFYRWADEQGIPY